LCENQRVGGRQTRESPALVGCKEIIPNLVVNEEEKRSEMPDGWIHRKEQKNVESGSMEGSRVREEKRQSDKA